MFRKIMIPKKIICLTIIAMFIIAFSIQGASIMAETKENSKKESLKKENIKNESDNLIKPSKFKSFEEYVDYLKSLDFGGMGYGSTDDMADSNRTDSFGGSSFAPKATAETSYGETNTQVAGVDEADIIKNDGKNIYILNRNINKVQIISAFPATSMNLVAEINLQVSNDNNYRYYNDMYLKDNKLILIYTLSRSIMIPEVVPYEIQGTLRDSDMAIGKIAPNYMRHINFSGAEIYDISDKQNFKLERTVMAEGNLVSSRMIDDTIYLMSSKYSYFYYPQPADMYTKENLMVAYSDSKIGDELKYVPIENMYCILDKDNPQNMLNISTILALDTNENGELNITNFTGTGHQMYTSLNNIYLFGQSWDQNNTYTDIYKYKIKGTNVEFAASNKVLGSILNQFSADEYNGYFRIATNSWNDGNNIFILDENLQKTGEIIGLAKGEQIKSCRFMGDKGYVVTYRNIDPLFSLDLSNPNKPIVTGELKIPGFSSYLHPLSENLIIGIGENTTPLYWRDENGNEIEAGVRQIGIKVSLFDVADESKPVELKALTIGGPGSYTDIGYDHKSFMHMKDKDLVAIRGTFNGKPVNGQEFYEYKSQAILISVKNNTLNIEKILDGNISYETGNRVTYIGDVLYHFTGNEVIAYRLSDYTKLGFVKYN